MFSPWRKIGICDMIKVLAKAMMVNILQYTSASGQYFLHLKLNTMPVMSQ